MYTRGPRGPPGAPRGAPGPGGPGTPSRGGLPGGPGDPQFTLARDPLPGGSGTPSRGGVPGGIDTLPDWRWDLAVQRYWETRDNGPQGARKMACGQVRAHQVVPTRELGPDWVGAIPTWGARGPPRARVRCPSMARKRSAAAIWYTDFQTPPLPLDFNEFCQKRNPVSTIFGAAGDGSESLSLRSEVPSFGWGSAA
jgi:hypothetical protein